MYRDSNFGNDLKSSESRMLKNNSKASTEMQYKIKQLKNSSNIVKRFKKLYRNLNLAKQLKLHKNISEEKYLKRLK